MTGDDFVQCTGTERFRMKIEAIDYAVPVGVVAYGPEAIGGMSRLSPG